MGLLPSQKYDFVLESFHEYLKYHKITFGDDDEWDKRIINDFLCLCNEGLWEL